MNASELTAAQFAKYPPHARALALANLDLLRQVPLALLPSLLREVVDYDYKFPAECLQLEGQLRYLRSLSAAELAECMQGFAQIRVSAQHLPADWCSRPLKATEQLSAYLWSTHQIEAFRGAAVAYGERLQAALPPQQPDVPRLGLVAMGQGASANQPRLFLKLRDQGTLFTNVDPSNGLQMLMTCIETRARQNPAPYAHWYVDGGAPVEHAGGITSTSYAGLAPARAALFGYIQEQVKKPGMGPEELRDSMAELAPAALGLTGDAVLDHFQMKILAEGSGSQIFSTTFTQWTTREALRRAEPLTVLARYAPRQRQRPMNELLAGDASSSQLDPEGSLVDSDMAAYYHYLNQQRLSGAVKSSLLVWFEGQRQAIAIGPALPRGVQSSSAVTVASILALLIG